MLAWEFWIDVGGTFTDCIGRAPDGRLVTHKLLSTGVYKLEVLAGSTAEELRVALPRNTPAGFFDGFRARLRAPAGELATAVASTTCEGLRLSPPLPSAPAPGTQVELASGEEAPVTGIRWLLGRRLGEPLGAIGVRLGTTRGTNALLERQGARVGFVTTRGFADVLAIAYQNRPRLFDLSARKPRPLYEAVTEIDERMDAAGRPLRAPDPAQVSAALQGLRARGVDAIALCLLNAHKNPAHERVVAAAARAAGFGHVSVSSELSALQRLVPRGNTTVVDAYLTPVIRDYVRRLRAQLPEGSLELMTSAGGLVDAAAFVGKDSIYSGPAGGAVGVAAVAADHGFDRAIGFDMGGTSTDVCRFEGAHELRYEMELCAPGDDSGVRITAPMLAIETVAAGGGSICGFDGVQLRVGPRSAGADPGPACYGRGGPLTITDVNLLLGRLAARHFPFPLDVAAVERRVDELLEQVRRESVRPLARDELLAGLVAVADSAMVAPIRKISLARGYDVRDYLLVSFGGAGAQHACHVADELGMTRILQPRHASVLSAYGIGAAEVRLQTARDVGAVLSSATLTRVAGTFAEMSTELDGRMRHEHVDPTDVAPPIRLLDLRYAGQETAITLREPAGGDWAGALAEAHRRLYGFTLGERPIEVRAARLELVSMRRRPAPVSAPPSRRRVTPTSTTRVHLASGWVDAPLFERDGLVAGDVVDGPAMIVEPMTTVIVEAGWTAELRGDGDLLLERREPARAGAPAAAVAEADPVQLALYHHRFALVAEEMGVTLQKTALSVNVKERLDFSCAVFGADGSLVVNAPHIPVHLGSMGATVQAVLRLLAPVHPGDVFITNDPYLGGSHLPDVTVITPVFSAQGELLFFTGNRAHHAEIGGIAPGSMPPFGRTLGEEGIIISPRRLVAAGRPDEEGLAALLASGPHPSRAVSENLADVRAQVAANELGRQRLLELLGRHGQPTVLAFLGHIQQAAAHKMRRALARLSAGTHRFEDRMDDGTPIVVAVTVSPSGEALVDFTGTGPSSPGNLNANPAIVRAAVLYSFRCLLDEEVPLNDGFLTPIRIVVPPGSLLAPEAGPDPSARPAVVAGNVETSQRVVDVLLGALGAAAASQGTMNNLLFGRAATPSRPGFGYYETICGGAGAGPTFDGESAVHTHMTNTRITDPEVLEERYPVRLLRFEIRRGSGGAGQHRGGDGVIREIEALEPLEASLVTGRRVFAPYGVCGGAPGSPGRNILRRSGATTVEELGPMAAVSLLPGDVLRLETPGGGGWGSVT